MWADFRSAEVSPSIFSFSFVVSPVQSKKLSEKCCFLSCLVINSHKKVMNIKAVLKRNILICQKPSSGAGCLSREQGHDKNAVLIDFGRWTNSRKPDSNVCHPTV